MRLEWKIAFGIVLGFGLILVLILVFVLLSMLAYKFFAMFDWLQLHPWRCFSVSIIGIGIYLAIFQSQDFWIIMHHPGQTAILSGVFLGGGLAFFFFLNSFREKMEGKKTSMSAPPSAPETKKEMTWKEAWQRSPISEKLFIFTLGMLLLISVLLFLQQSFF